MSRYHYDLHLHSCLSPCSDNDMTPGNIAGMAALCGLQMAALTDHNTTANCRAFYTACRTQGIIPIAGMELTTAEDIHLICLFEELEHAEAFGLAVAKKRIRYPNRSEIFGDQLIMNEDDEVVGVEEDLLINATELSIEEAVALVKSYDGVVYPAHIDRESNGIIAVLGDFPETPHFGCVEFNFKDNVEAYTEKYRLKDKKVLVSSDAHHLWDVQEAGPFVELADEPYSSALVRHRFFEYLKS